MTALAKLGYLEESTAIFTMLMKTHPDFVEKRLQFWFEQIELSKNVEPQLKQIVRILSEYFEFPELLTKQLQILYNELNSSGNMKPHVEKLFQKLLGYLNLENQDS